jgi:hypothetical protein
MFHVSEPTEPANGNQHAPKEGRSSDRPIGDAAISLALGLSAESLLFFGSFFHEKHPIGKLCYAVHVPVRDLVIVLIGPHTGDSLPVGILCSVFGAFWLFYAIVIYAALAAFHRPAFQLGSCCPDSSCSRLN